MPIYEYVCQACGTPFEKLLGFSQADLPQTCPACGETQSRRQLSSFAVGGAVQTQTAMRPAPGPVT